MSAKLLAPDIRRIIEDFGRRIAILERRITGEPAAIDDSHSIIFSHSGTVLASTSPPARVWKGGNLTVLAVTFGTAGSTDTVIAVERNGTTVATVTVPASTEAYNGTVSARYVADVDTLSLTVTSAGTGAADMTAEARFT